MQELPGFEVRLRRLAELRGVDAGSPGASAGLPQSHLELRQLAPVLGLHTSDLFIIADQEVPADLRPLDATGGVVLLAWPLTYLSGAVPRLHQLVTSLPQQARPPGPPPPRPAHEQYPNGAGGLLVRLLRNRGLHWSGVAKFLFGVGRGPMLSASTIGAIGHGRKDLTPELLTRLAALLDLPARDLSALTGVELTTPDPPVHPDAAEVATLLWDARRLTAAQLGQVDQLGHVIQHEEAGQLDTPLRCRCASLPSQP